MRRRVGVALAAALISLVLPLAAAEIALRFLPVASGLRTQPVSAEQPVFRFEADRTFTYSKGWRFDLANRGRVNNAGFVSEIDYRSDAPGPLLAVIGDSYVEALVTPWRETAHGRLAAALEGSARVYSFGASGAPLSQYLAWARHACAAYRPDAAVFVVVGNDFDESLAAVKRAPGFHHYVERPDGRLALERVDYRPGALRMVVHASALARYLAFNLEAAAAPARVLALLREPTGFAGNTDSAAASTRLSASRRAVDAFLNDLAQTCLPPGRAVFLLDGIRPELYDEAALAAASGSYFAVMRAEFLAATARRGYEAVDLQPAFVAAHRLDGRRFEYETDAHWNGAGHEIAARAAACSQTVRRALPAANIC